MKIFYHADDDGKCAGYWVGKLAYEDNYEKEFIKIDYDMKFPFEKINKGEYVYIVDFSILPSEMDKLLIITENVTWIDHHISSIKKYDKYDKNIRGLRYNGIAGCMLTYCYLKHMTSGGCGDIKTFNVDMCEDAPLFTRIIADYDVWKFEYGSQTKKFHYGFETYAHEPYEVVWFDLEHSNDTFLEIIEKGDTIINYRKKWMKEYCDLKGFETEICGYKAFAINMANISSDDFSSLNNDLYDLFIGFSYNGKEWNYSLRSTKINCAEIAMKYGGGGHVGAAGFNINELILKSIN